MIVKKTYLVLALIAVAAIAAGALLLNGSFRKTPNPASAETASYPKDYAIYQGYLQAIGEGLSATPRHFDNAVIEATVLSVTNSDACPSAAGETCNIEPYPNDYAVVRIDKIVSYSPYSEQVSQVVEGAQQEGAGNDSSSVAGYSGVDYPKQKAANIARLQEGQNASAHFLLTARPVKVVYAPMQERKGARGLESSRHPERDIPDSGGESPDSTQTVSHSSAPRTDAFEPIPEENGYFVFTTKVVPVSEAGQKVLPGLKAGDKFRASIKYDGATVVVGEYETCALNEGMPFDDSISQINVALNLTPEDKRFLEYNGILFFFDKEDYDTVYTGVNKEDTLAVSLGYLKTLPAEYLPKWIYFYYEIPSPCGSAWPQCGSGIMLNSDCILQDTLVHEIGHSVQTSRFGYNYTEGKLKEFADLTWQLENNTFVKRSELVTQSNTGFSYTKGFVSPYSMSAPAEDFADTFSYYMLYGNYSRYVYQYDEFLKAKYEWMKTNVFNGIEFDKSPNPLDNARNYLLIGEYWDHNIHNNTNALT